MIVNMVSGKSREKMPPLYTVSGGTSTYAQSVASDGTVNWELALLSGSNATITFDRVVDYVDVFICGGGASGGNSNGGNGGAVATYSNVTPAAGTAYAFTVGESDGPTGIFGVAVASGGGSAGGRGADWQTTARATAGTDGVYAFGSSASLIYSGRKYGAGGGGGGTVSGNNSYNGGAGGASGGGHGADRSHTTVASASGAANTGGGGGAGCWDGPYNRWYSAGSGGSGIIIIRNHRG